MEVTLDLAYLDTLLCLIQIMQKCEKVVSIKPVEDHAKEKADLYYAETIIEKSQLIYKFCYVQLLKNHQVQCKHVKKAEESPLLPPNTNSFDFGILTIFTFWCKKEQKISPYSASFAATNSSSLVS